MNTFTESFFKRVFKLLYGKPGAKSFKNGVRLACDYGHYRSARSMESVDALGDPIPWYCYPCLEYLNNHDLAGLNILEYGSGNSSLYFLNRMANVTSIEDNQDWYEKISQVSGESHSYIFESSLPAYVKRTTEISNADIVVIDGSHRVECADFVCSSILDGHSNPRMIIFDNSDWYPETISKLDSELQWLRVDFCGFGPINDYSTATSIFLNSGRKVPRLQAPLRPLNGLQHSRG